MAAGLDALQDRRVGPGGECGAGLLDRAALITQAPTVRRFGRPQKVTTTSASAAASNQSRRAKGSSRFTASGLAVSARAPASSRRIAAAPLTAIVPSPPASDTAAASS